MLRCFGIATGAVGARRPAIHQHRRLRRLANLLLALQCLALATGLPSRARADGFSVNPTHLELKGAQRSTALSLANYNNGPMFMQVRIYRWERKAGADVLSEAAGSEAPLVTPPLFRLAARGGSQIVRIGSPASSAPQTEERQWRVIVEEVPTSSLAAPEPAAGTPAADADSPPLSVAIHMRVSLPLFERPAVVRQALEWDLMLAGGGHVALIADNQGTITERLDDISLSSPGRQNVHLQGPLYVFPGERRSFAVDPEIILPGGSMHLSVQGTPRPLTHELVLSAQ